MWVSHNQATIYQFELPSQSVEIQMTNDGWLISAGVDLERSEVAIFHP